MSAIRLLVLGSVRHHGRAHGYQVRGDLESWGAHEWSSAKPGSIYHALKQLARQELLVAHEVEPSAAGGPPRVVYSITDEGTHTFFTLLRGALSSPDTKVDVLSAGLGFMVDLPRDEVAALLRERLDGLWAWHASVSEYYSPEDGPTSLGHIGEIMDLWVRTAEASAVWTRGLIERIEAGAHVFAGEEGEPYEGVFTEEV
ncbi:PadR family transcriptional regulator [Nocardiopsis sp. HNM0947]|uniref:PadR family transcriptional regulator n=1 Tax=Nocardiopsis coralli TaxID=2772213 RepID=A0ABR9P591_9ACTN|nr:PadR family transcriptional regulator [Nocardiopsis coralli]MBE2999008.1 PadR family transcriptional regulator [Nocardiopsis coralli]